MQDVGQPVFLRAVELEEHAVLDALVRLERQLQVLEHRQLLEHRGFLELAANAQLGNFGFVMAQQVDGRAKEHRAFVGPGLAGDDVHHRGLACTIGSDDAAQLAGRDVQVQAVDGLEAVKAHMHIFQVQDAAMGHIHLTGHGNALHAGAAVAGFGIEGRFFHGRTHAGSARFHQVRGHAAPPSLRTEV